MKIGVFTFVCVFSSPKILHYQCICFIFTDYISTNVVMILMCFISKQLRKNSQDIFGT